ncbi:very short patch repair endonuclease [Limosilactobacillus avium]|uniref:very short patch repair endonuclease n=1 Tax=Limosilactobacillus avium TaxID=2991831 RepID=UPI0024BB22A9|nr:very short patch repair endonuclease [Limosilactobacillus avium]
MKHPRSYNTDAATRKRMSNVHLKYGKDENLLALSLWHDGIRYRRNYKKLPGSPDIAITKYKIAVFVDGEFWHGYDWEYKKKRLKRNRNYWVQKIEENIRRDKRNDILLRKKGWQPIHFWAKTVLKNTDYCVAKIEYFIRSKEEND